MKKSFFFFLFFSFLQSNAQVTSEKIKQVFADNQSVKTYRLNDENLVSYFYSISGYNLSWMKPGDSIIQKELFTLFSTAATYGLNKNDYQQTLVAFFEKGKIPVSLSDTIETDIKLTDAALHFFSEVKNGNKPPAFMYNGLNYKPDNTYVAQELKDACARQDLSEVIKKVEPVFKVYKNAKNLLAFFDKTMSKDDFEEVVVRTNKVDSSNQPLLVKLVQLGITDSVRVSDPHMIMQKVQKMQKMLSLLNDGKLRSTTLAALNIPIRQRREELKLFINYIKWLHGLSFEQVAILNLPSTTLYVYVNDSLIINSKIVAGKPASPTPTLSSKIEEVILYPYWNVPHSIATKELLPSIKRNPGYLEANNFQVLNKAGQVLNPYSVPWQSLSASNFPYTIRQSTGCDNALGVVKFNFYNPFSVYLHDTPSKGLFFMDKRFFSHGCMRVEKPVTLAQYVLKEKASEIERITKQCLKDQKPKVIALSKPLPLVVLYSTVWYNEKGELQFYEDVYHKLSFDKNAFAINE